MSTKPKHKKQRKTKLHKIQELVNEVFGDGFTAHLYKGVVYIERDSDQHYKMLHSQDFAIYWLNELKADKAAGISVV